MSVSTTESNVTEKSATQNTWELRQANPHSSDTALPENPVVVIEPTRAWSALNLKDLWAFHELLYFLTWRDIKVRYKQTVLGVTWVVIQPIVATIIFVVFLGKLARVPSGGIPYPILVFAGLLPWTFFANAVIVGSVSLVSSAHLITKIYFPRLIIPAAAVASRLVDFAIAFVILIGMMIYYRVPITRGILMMPALIILVTFLALGFAVLSAALNVKYRDVGVAVPVLIQLWMFVSPVLYPVALVPERWRTIYFLNPMAGIVDGFRALVVGHSLNWQALGIASLFTIVLLMVSSYFFRRVERTFADII